MDSDWTLQWIVMFYRFPAAAVWRSRVKAMWWPLQRTIIMFWSSTLSISPDRPSWQQQDEWSRDRTLVRGHFCDLSILPLEHAMVMQVSIFSFLRFNIENIQSFCCFADACAKENLLAPVFKLLYSLAVGTFWNCNLLCFGACADYGHVEDGLYHGILTDLYLRPFTHIGLYISIWIVISIVFLYTSYQFTL